MPSREADCCNGLRKETDYGRERERKREKPSRNVGKKICESEREVRKRLKLKGALTQEGEEEVVNIFTVPSDRKCQR